MIDVSGMLSFSLNIFPPIADSQFGEPIEVFLSMLE